MGDKVTVGFSEFSDNCLNLCNYYNELSDGFNQMDLYCRGTTIISMIQLLAYVTFRTQLTFNKIEILNDFKIENYSTNALKQ